MRTHLIAPILSGHKAKNRQWSLGFVIDAGTIERQDEGSAQEIGQGKPKVKGMRNGGLGPENIYIKYYEKILIP